MPATKRKAFAYVTNRDRLLVLSHPNAPEAGPEVEHVWGGTLGRGPIGLDDYVIAVVGRQ